MPGSNARAIEKAKGLAADVVIFDLEDAVAPDAKGEARDRVVAALRDEGFGRRERVVRINAPGTPWAEEDYRAAAAAGADAILVPKVSHAGELNRIEAGATPLWAMVETPMALLNLAAIAAAPRLGALVVGLNDLAKEMRARALPGREPFHAALTMAVAAARAYGRTAIDAVFNDIGDVEGLAAECAQGRAFGFDGKSLIHPSQIEACNRAYSPDAGELAEARAVIAAFERPENAGKAVIAVEGRMVERLHLDSARRLVALDEAIAAL